MSSAIVSLLSQTSNFVANPILATLDEVQAFVLNEYNEGKQNVAHPFKNFIVFCIDGDVHIVANTLPSSHFRSAVGMDTIESKLFEMMDNFSEHFAEFRNLPVNILFGGKSGRIKMTESFQIFTLTDRSMSSQYFDLVAYGIGSDGQVKSVDFRNQNALTGVHHSGDIGSLLHTLTISDMTEGSMLLVGAVGYSLTPLKNFVNQNPLISIVGDGVINIVPCPLDEVTLGNATFSALLLCTVEVEGETSYLKYRVLPRPITADGIDTCMVTEELSDKVQAIFVEGFPIAEVVAEVVTKVVAEGTTDVVKGMTSIQTSLVMSVPSATVGNVVEFVQKDLLGLVPHVPSELIPMLALVKAVPQSIVIPFGTGIGDTVITEEQMNIPNIFGTVRGHPSVLCATPYDGPVSAPDYIRFIKESHIIVHLALTGWDDYISSNTCKFVGNCVFVIHVNDIDFASIGERKINCLTMAGPRSTILVENHSKFYFYRGIECAGIRKAKFVEEVSFNVTNWLAQPIVWDVITERDDNRIVSYSGLANRSFGFDSAITYFEQMNAEDIRSIDPTNLINIFVQMTVAYNAQEISKISGIILMKLSEAKENITGALKTQLDTLLQSSEPDISAIKAVSKQIRNVSTEFDARYADILEFLNMEMVSAKGCVSMNHTLDRIKRKNDIKQNVDATLVMKSDDIINEIVDKCQTEGIVLFSVNVDHLMDCVRELHNGLHNTSGFHSVYDYIDRSYPQLCTLSPFVPNVRCLNLDSDTYSSVAAVTKTRDRPFSQSPQSLTLPFVGGQASYEHVSASLAVPLYDEFTGLENPYNTDWHTVCNNPHIAHYRIALRSTFTNSVECRDVSIRADSVELGAMLCIFILGYIETYICDVLASRIPDNGSTSLRTVRGLTCFLLTLMASGVNSQISAWEIFKPFVAGVKRDFTVPKSVKTFDIYFRLLKVIPYCKWSQGIAIQNLRFIGKVMVQKSSEEV